MLVDLLQFQPLDAKREEFRRYLEKSGVMDAFTKVLVGLYEEPEKPNDALEIRYVKKHLGDSRPDDVELETMKTELEECKARIKEMEQENEELKKRLSAYEPANTGENADIPATE
ncbi:hypothetical protein J437_LFUL016589 [Ladona fulva]|uniref:c-Myc-binding protein n=1 Tax=Ladona fulva TaxID=123851 RepID=A0A8K0K0E2_LADFU|nr:hypothetical protein J437_LFUL016589 [Ladona fulva]